MSDKNIGKLVGVETTQNLIVGKLVSEDPLILTEYSRIPVAAGEFTYEDISETIRSKYGFETTKKSKGEVCFKFPKFHVVAIHYLPQQD